MKDYQDSPTSSDDYSVTYHGSTDGRSVGYDSLSDTYRQQWTQTETVGTAVVLAVAAVTGSRPTDLPTLASVVDVDALDQAVRTGTSVSVSFRYAGCAVTVCSGGTVSVDPQ